MADNRRCERLGWWVVANIDDSTSGGITYDGDEEEIDNDDVDDVDNNEVGSDAYSISRQYRDVGSFSTL